MSYMQDCEALNSYSGADELEVMKIATNYNSSLVKLVGAYIPKHGRVLDFGAGNGLFAGLIAKKFDVLSDCLEPDPKLSLQIKENLPKSTLFSELDQVEPGSYDLVYSLNVLEHIENDIEILKKLKTKLRPGGKLFIYVPAFMILFSSNDVRVGHFRRYTRQSMLKILTEADFVEVERLEYFDTVGFFAALAYRILAAKNEGSLNPKSVRLFDKAFFPMNCILDPFVKNILGKNLIAVCRKI